LLGRVKGVYLIGAPIQLEKYVQAEQYITV
jgi:hypothetical protein